MTIRHAEGEHLAEGDPHIWHDPRNARVVVHNIALALACVPAVGTLLAVALLTVPALAARQWTDRVGRMTVLAAAFGALSGG